MPGSTYVYCQLITVAVHYQAVLWEDSSSSGSVPLKGSIKNTIQGSKTDGKLSWQQFVSWDIVTPRIIGHQSFQFLKQRTSVSHRSLNNWLLTSGVLLVCCIKISSRIFFVFFCSSILPSRYLLSSLSLSMLALLRASSRLALSRHLLTAWNQEIFEQRPRVCNNDYLSASDELFFFVLILLIFILTCWCHRDNILLNLFGLNFTLKCRQNIFAIESNFLDDEIEACFCVIR